MSDLIINTKLNSKWVLWYHHQKDNWKLEGYKQIYTVETIKEFWSLFNNLHIIGGISKLQYFFMRENITPLWEDEKNRNGGCWSIKITKDVVEQIWQQLSILLVTENIFTTNKSDVNGLSICMKNSSVIIKIWIFNNNIYNKIKNLNKIIFNKFGYNIIYKQNNVEY